MFMNLSFSTSFHGLTSEVLDITSELGSTPANLSHHLAFFGASLGCSPFVFWRGKKTANLGVMLVGESACGKGESLGIIESVYDFPEQDMDLIAPMLMGTLSGNKFIPTAYQIINTREDGECRLLNIDQESNARLKTAAAWNSQHDEKYCRAFDGNTLTDSIGNHTIYIPRLHFGSIGHITPMALQNSMKRESFFNGYANRVLWMGVPTQDFRDFAGDYDEQAMAHLHDELAMSLREGSIREKVEFTDSALAQFTDYAKAHRQAMKVDQFLNAATGRLDELCIKTALILCLCNRETKIENQVIDEAIAVMEYYKATMLSLFGSEARAEAPCETICKYLAVHGATSRTDLMKAMTGTLSRTDVEDHLNELARSGRVRCEQRRAPRGRFPHFYTLVKPEN
jgi:hypothetical protein